MVRRFQAFWRCLHPCFGVDLIGIECDWQVCTLTGYSGGVTRVQFSNDGAEVISASDDGTVRLSLDVWV